MTNSDLINSDLTNSDLTNYAIVIGASSLIAQSTVLALTETDGYDKIVCFSRGQRPESLSTHSPLLENKLDWRQTDYTPDMIRQQTQTLHQQIQNDPSAAISRVIICLGKLHSKLHNKLHDNGLDQSHSIKPEKRLEDFNAFSAESSMQVNAITPMIWLQQLLPILKSKTPCKVAVLSARVGSLGYNGLGGWYAYRASKAALNMMLKTAAIEFARRAKNIKLVAFHPGTVDTPLSKPFQSSVPPGKLFTPEFVAQQLLNILETVPVDGALSYLDWNNQPITW